SVCQSSIAGILTNNEYASSTTKELKNILSGDTHGIRFVKVSKKHFDEILTNVSPKNYHLLIQSSKLVLKDNSNYITNLFSDISSITNSFPTLIDDGSIKFQNDVSALKKKIVVLLSHLLVELLNKGYTKQYIYNFFQITFIRNSKPGNTFNDNLNILKSLSSKSDEEFTVIFKIIGSSFQFTEFKKIDSMYELVNKRYRQSIKPLISTSVNDFLEQNKEGFLLYIKIKAPDFFKAIEVSMDKISKDMDIYHLGFTKHPFKIDSKCAVIGSLEPSKAETFPSNFQIDGYIRSHADVFAILLQKIKKIEQNNVDRESYDKILSAIRYYRTGSESPELETKLLNYWIGLEYIFTSFKNEEKTIDRMKNAYPICHSLIYVKRKLQDFHKTLNRLGVSHLIADYNDDLVYLTKHKTYDDICLATNNELLKFRARYFQKWVESPGNIDEALRKHTTNLQWNITRLYRIRNEIVHNAAIKKGIYIHISHIKYYMTFILNSVLDYMADVHVDVNNDGKVSIEDYFIAQNIMLGSIKGDTIRTYITINNPSQIFN
ncbi:MAG: hypothetical protein ACXVHT_11330, partial [Methanobacterium sp.]